MNKFLVGLIFGIAIAGGLAVYLNNAPTPFMNKAVEPVNNDKSSSPMILAPGTKIKEASATTSNSNTATQSDNKTNASEASYDFYDVLQAKKVVNNNSNDVAAAKPKASAPTPQTKFFVQAGAFSSEELAADMKGRLALLGIDSTIKSQGNGSNVVNRVLIGPLATEENAQKIINQLSDGQINAALIRVTK